MNVTALRHGSSARLSLSSIGGKRLTNDVERSIFLGRLLWASLDTRGRAVLVSSVAMIVCLSYGSSFAPVLFTRFLNQLSTEPSIGTAALVLVASFLGVNWLSAMARELLWVTVGPIQQRVQRRANAGMFDHAVRLPYEFHVGKSTGELLEKLSQGQSGMSHVLFTVLTGLLPIVLQTFFVLLNGAVLLPLSITSVMFVLVASYLGALYVGAERIRGHQRTAQANLIRARGVMTDALGSIETVKAFDREEAVCRRYDSELGDAERGFGRFLRARFALGAAQVTIGVSCVGVAIGIGMFEFSNGTMTIGDLVLIQIYCAQLIQPLQGLSQQYREIRFGLTSLDGIAEVLSLGDATERSSLDKERGVAARRVSAVQVRQRTEGALGNLQLHDVSVRRSERKVLDRLSATFVHGQETAIVGPTGAGKSTIVKLLLRLIQPDTGCVLVGEDDLSDLFLPGWLERVSFVPQDVVLFNDTLAGNLRFATADVDRAAMNEVLELTRLDGLVSNHPDGIDMLVGERGQRLSGGERQRVGIARALLRKPDVYLFDEATSALDLSTEKDLMSDLRSFTRGATIVAVTHRVRSAADMDRIVVVEGGTATQSGTHAELLALDGPYRTLWGSSSDASEPDA